MMPTLIKKLKVSLCFSWVWIAGIVIWTLAASSTPISRAQSGVVTCATGSSIPILPSLTLTIAEGGYPVVYSVTLCTEPSELVTVTLKLDSTASQALKLDREDIKFTKINWNTPEPVTVRAENNGELNMSPRTAIIGHSASSNDENYNYPNEDNPQVKFIISDSGSRNYLPMVSKPITPTAIATPTPTLTPAIAGWKQLATNPSDVEVLATDGSNIIAGDRSSSKDKQGIYRSTSCQNGTTFTKVRENISVEDLAFKKELGIGIAASNGDRVYYTSNKGESWQRTNSSMNQFVFAVAFTNSGTAYAGTDDGVYTSTNNGITWGKVTPASKGPTLINMFTYPEGEDTLWIGTYGSGVWKLPANTTQFTQVANGLNNPNGEGRVWDILRRTANEFYIATTNGVYKGDGVGNWSAFGLQGLQVLSLELADNILYAGIRDGGVQHTLLGGAAAWSKESGIASTLTVRDLLYDQNDLCNDQATGRKALLAGTTNGIWVYR